MPKGTSIHDIKGERAKDSRRRALNAAGTHPSWFLRFMALSLLLALSWTQRQTKKLMKTTLISASVIKFLDRPSKELGMRTRRPRLRNAGALATWLAIVSSVASFAVFRSAFGADFVVT